MNFYSVYCPFCTKEVSLQGDTEEAAICDWNFRNYKFDDNGITRRIYLQGEKGYCDKTIEKLTDRLMQASRQIKKLKDQVDIYRNKSASNLGG